MRRYIPALLLVLAAAAPFPLTGCTDLINKLKGGGGDEDAAADAALIAEPDAEATPAAPLDTDASEPTVAPTTTLTAVTPTATPTPAARVDGGVTDAGTKVDAAAPVADAAAPTDGGPAPAPTPTLTLPKNFFDGGLLPGLKVDAGGWKPPWQK